MSQSNQKPPRVILYVDDDQAHGALVQRRLRHENYRVDLAVDGAEAELKMARFHYDLVLFDYHLPDGVCSEIIPKYTDIDGPPMVVISAADDVSFALEALRLGAVDYIVKAIDNSHLKILPASINRAMAQHEKLLAKRKAELELYNKNNLLRNVLDNIPHSVYWKDLNSVYLGCNANFGKSAELADPEEIVGKTDEDMPWEKEAALFRESDRMVMEQGPRYNHEITYFHKDGQMSTFLSSALPLTDPKRKMVGIVSIFVDITKRKQVEEDVVRRGQELEEKNRMLELKNQEILRVQEQLIAQEKMASLGTMAAGIAHEIRNPLNFIQNLSTLSATHAREIRQMLSGLQNKVGEDVWAELDTLLSDIDENATVISRHGERAARIVGSMMDLANGGASHFVSADINSLVDEYVNLLYRGKREATTVDITMVRDRSLDCYPVVPQNIGRVIINLLNNAVDASLSKCRESPGHQPRITVTTVNGEDSFTIKVADNGPGIPPDIRDKIFHPFFTTKQAGEGNSGLGLSICYDIVVNEHKGEFLLNSEEGEFAEFILRLPKG